MKRFKMFSTLNDVVTIDDTRIVDQTHVDRYMCDETLSFFRGLGGTEVVEELEDGTIRVTSTSSDGSLVRVATFVVLAGDANGRAS